MANRGLTSIPPAMLGLGVSFSLVLQSCSSPAPLPPSTDVARQEALASGELREQDGVRFIRLRGTHREMGVRYGQILKRDLYAISERMREYERSIIDELPWYVSPFAGAFKFFKVRGIPSRLFPEHVEEVQGMAEGSGLPEKDLMFFAGGAGVLGCTSVLARTPNGVVHGRNFDFWPYFLGDFPVVVDAQAPGENRVINFGIVGYPGLFTGVNDKGVSVSLNLSTTRDEESHGPLTQFKLKRALETSSNLAEVDAFLRARENDEQGWMMTFASRTDDTGVIYDAIGKELRKTPLAGLDYVKEFNNIFAENRFPEGAALRKRWLKFTMAQGDYQLNRESLARKFIESRKLDGAPAVLDFLSQQGLRTPGDFPEYGVNNDGTMQTFLFEAKENRVIFGAAQGFAAAAPLVRFDVATGAVTHFRDATPSFLNGNMRLILDTEAEAQKLWARGGGAAEFGALMSKKERLQVPVLALLVQYHREAPDRVPPGPLVSAVDDAIARYPDYAALWHWKGVLAKGTQPGEAVKAWEHGLTRSALSPMVKITLLSALAELHETRKETTQARARAREVLAALREAESRFLLSPWLKALAEDMEEIAE